MSKRVVLVFTLVLLLSVSLFVSGVSATKSENGDSIPIEVFTDKTVYKINESIVIYIKVTNPTDSPLPLHFSSSLQFDYEIRDNCNNLIYRWSHGKVFLAVFTSVTIPAGDSIIKRLPPYSLSQIGTYTITGIVAGYHFTDTTQIVVSGEIIPEFPPFLILPLFVIATLATAIYIKKGKPK